MEIQYHGANCLRITTKKSTLVIDPASDITDIKTDLKKATAILATQDSLAPAGSGDVFMVNGPGEYEFEDFSVVGIATQPHTGASGDKSATIYRITSQDIIVLVVGHTAGQLSEEQLELIGIVDVVVVPVGGNGYTLDGVGAATVVRAIEPKMVIPVHSNEDDLRYQVPQTDRQDFIKELSAPVAEDIVEKLKIKTLPEQLTIQLMKRS